MTESNRLLDKVAIWLSGICLAHCLAIPVAVLLLPFVGESLLGSETLVHWVLLAGAVPISILALWHGQKRHARPTPGIIGALGLTIMFLGVSHLFDRSLEIPLTISGVALVTVAHVMNLRLLHRLA